MPRVLSPEEVAALGLDAPEPSAPAPTPAKDPTAEPEVSGGTALARGFAQGGTYGYADELGGAAAVAGNWLKEHPNVANAARGVLGAATAPLGPVLGQNLASKAVDKLSNMGVSEGVEVNTEPQPGDTPEILARKREIAAEQAARPSSYQLVRDAMRAEDKAAKEQHPYIHGAGEVVGNIAADYAGGKVLRPVAGAAEGISTAKQAAKTGAVMGGVMGLGGSDADLTKGDVLGAAIDTGLGAAGGAAGGALAHSVTEFGKNKIQKPLADWLKKKAQIRALKATGYRQKGINLLGEDRARETADVLLDNGLIKPFRSAPELHEGIDAFRQKEGQKIGGFLKQADAAPGAGFNMGRVTNRAAREIGPDLQAPGYEPQQAELVRYLKSLKNTNLNGQGFQKANWIKGRIQDRVPKNAWQDAKAEHEVKLGLQRLLHQEIDKQAEQKLGGAAVKGFQQARKNYGAAANALRNNESEFAREVGNRAISPSDYAAFIAGMANDTGGASQGVLLAALNHILRERGSSASAVGLNKWSGSLARRAAENPELTKILLGTSAGAAGGETVLEKLRALLESEGANASRR